jgi:succinate dehydrogenase/fumarate reductase-like Fe-S protein
MATGTDSKHIVVEVRRTPEGSDAWTRYDVESEEPMTVFAALRAIYETLDGTLAFRNYTCWRTLCRACEVTLDGRPVKGCLAVLEPGGRYRVEPREGVAVTRDLFQPGRRPAEEA